MQEEYRVYIHHGVIDDSLDFKVLNHPLKPTDNVNTARSLHAIGDYSRAIAYYNDIWRYQSQLSVFDMMNLAESYESLGDETIARDLMKSIVFYVDSLDITEKCIEALGGIETDNSVIETYKDYRGNLNIKLLKTFAQNNWISELERCSQKVMRIIDETLVYLLTEVLNTPEELIEKARSGDLEYSKIDKYIKRNFKIDINDELMPETLVLH